MAFVQIPLAWQPQRDALKKALENSVTEGQHLYAVIDLAASTVAEDWLAYLQKTQSAYSLFEAQPEAEARAQAPWLLPLDQSETGVTRTVNEALVSRNVVWLTTRLPMTELIGRLSKRLAAVLEEDADKPIPPSMLFRYYDTRLFPGWWKSLIPQEKVTFGAFASSWQQLGVDNQLLHIALTGEPVVDPFNEPWVVTHAQQSALVDYSERHQLIDFLTKRQPDHFLPMSLQQQWQFVSKHNAAAKAHYVTTLEDRLYYCELALTKDSQFADASSWQPVWHAMEAGNTRLKEAIANKLPKVVV